MPNSNKRRPAASKKRAAFTAGAAAGLAALAAVPAMGAVNPAAGVDIRDGKQFVFVHNIELIGATGYTLGEQLTLQIIRGADADGTGGVPIAHVSEPAYDVEGSPGLEVNHGPTEVPPRPGDCFDVVTPNARPGDLVRVTDSQGGVDSAFIDNITVDTISDPTPADADGDVVLNGRAESLVGGVATPYTDPVFLNSGFWRGPGPTGVDSRGDFPDVDVSAGDGTYVATYTEGDRNWGQFRPVIADGGQPVDKDSVLSASHEFGYGHAEVDVNGDPIPAAKEIQLVEVDGPGPGGGAIVPAGEGVPVLGCEGQSRASTANDITAADDKQVNLTSQSLKLSGPADPAVTQVDVTLADGNGGSVSKTDSAPVSGFDSKAWQVEFTEAEVQGLADGTLTATATFTGAPPATATREIPKDTTPPPPPPPADPGTGGGSGDGGGAGAGGGGAGAGGAGVGAGAGGAGSPTVLPAVQRFVQVSSLRARSRLRLRSARRSGIRVSFVAPEGANVVRVQLFRGSRTAQNNRAIGQATIQLSRTGRHAVRLRSRALRKALRTGVYRIVISAGQSEDSLYQAVGKRIRIVR